MFKLPGSIVYRKVVSFISFFTLYLDMEEVMFPLSTYQKHDGCHMGRRVVMDGAGGSHGSPSLLSTTRWVLTMTSCARNLKLNYCEN